MKTLATLVLGSIMLATLALAQTRNISLVKGTIRMFRGRRIASMSSTLTNFRIRLKVFRWNAKAECSI